MGSTIFPKFVQQLAAITPMLMIVSVPASELSFAETRESAAAFVTGVGKGADTNASPSAKSELRFTQSPVAQLPVPLVKRRAPKASHTQWHGPPPRLQLVPPKTESVDQPSEHQQPTSHRGGARVISEHLRERPKKRLSSSLYTVNTQPVTQAKHRAARHASHQQRAPSAAPVKPSTKLLIGAHKLSLQATTEEHYTAITELCSEALQLGADGEKNKFGRHLFSWAMNRRGQLRLGTREHLAANADFQTALDYHPNNWRALHNRGVSHAQNQRYAEAFDDFNRVIELRPDYAKAYTNRATLLVKANDLASAMVDYERANLLDPSLAAAHVGLGNVCHRLGRLDEAVKNFGKAVHIDPTNVSIICSRGDLLADMGHYAAALADYARTIEINPDYGHAYRNGAWLLATCPIKEFRDPENALLGARKALEINYGERHVALDTLAAALASSGDFDKAVATISQAIELAPEGAAFAYLPRQQMYQERQPFHTEPVGNIAHAVYEAPKR
ncbi:MAG: tetratricopeptide repeat protein [Pirellulales bacterium]|nr:tetratricopeptide repeat protein [Pirellulales bacterium]